jgi:hypothetical protein
MYKKTKILALFIAIGAVLVTGLVSIPVLPSYAVDMDNEGGGSAPAPSASEGDDEDRGGGSAPAEPKDENEQEDETKDSTQQKETNNIDNSVNEPFNPNDFNQDNDVTSVPFNEPFNAQELEQNFEDTIKNTNTNDNKLSPDECKKRGLIDGSVSRFDNINLNECMAGLGTEGVGEYIGAYIAGCMDSGRDILSCQNDVKPVISASAPKSD